MQPFWINLILIVRSSFKEIDSMQMFKLLIFIFREVDKMKNWTVTDKMRGLVEKQISYHSTQ